MSATVAWAVVVLAHVKAILCTRYCLVILFLVVFIAYFYFCLFYFVRLHSPILPAASERLPLLAYLYGCSFSHSGWTWLLCSPSLSPSLDVQKPPQVAPQVIWKIIPTYHTKTYFTKFHNLLLGTSKHSSSPCCCKGLFQKRRKKTKYLSQGNVIVTEAMLLFSCRIMSHVTDCTWMSECSPLAQVVKALNSFCDITRNVMDRF